MKRIWNFIKKNPILLTFIVTIVSFSYAINEIHETADLAKESAVLAKRLAEEMEVDRIFDVRSNCEAINVSTDRLRKVVLVATSGTIAPDYTTMPEFEALKDESVKVFLIALRTRNATVGNAQAREEFLKGLDIRDCVKEYPLPSKPITKK